VKPLGSSGRGSDPKAGTGSMTKERFSMRATFPLRSIARKRVRSMAAVRGIRLTAPRMIIQPYVCTIEIAGRSSCGGPIDGAHRAAPTALVLGTRPAAAGTHRPPTCRRVALMPFQVKWIRFTVENASETKTRADSMSMETALVLGTRPPQLKTVGLHGPLDVATRKSVRRGCAGSECSGEPPGGIFRG
jgi:hypothetical protein